MGDSELDLVLREMLDDLLAVEDLADAVLAVDDVEDLVAAAALRAAARIVTGARARLEHFVV